MRCKRCDEVILVGESRCRKCGMPAETVGWSLKLYRIMTFLGFFVVPLASLRISIEFEREMRPYFNFDRSANVPMAYMVIMIVAMFVFSIASFILQIKAANLIKVLAWGRDVKAKVVTPAILWGIFAVVAWVAALIGTSSEFRLVIPGSMLVVYHGLMLIPAFIAGRKVKKMRDPEAEISERKIEEAKKEWNISGGSSARRYSDSESRKPEIPGKLYYVYSKLCHSEPKEEIWDKGSTGSMRWSAMQMLEIFLFWILIGSLAVPNIIFIMGGGIDRLSSGVGTWSYFGTLILSIGAYIAICLFQRRVVRAMEEKRWDKKKDSAIGTAFIIWLVLAAVLLIMMMFVEASVAYHAVFLAVGSVIEIIMLFMGFAAKKAVKKCEACSE